MGKHGAYLIEFTKYKEKQTVILNNFKNTTMVTTAMKRCDKCFEREIREGCAKN